MFARRRELPLRLQTLVLLIHVTCPALLLVKGNQSAIFLVDIIAPVLLAGMLISNTSHGSPRAVSTLNTWLVAMLIVVPMTTGIAAAAAGNMGEVGPRELRETAIWFYRNVVFLCVFALAARHQVNGTQAIAISRMILLLSTVAAALGMVSYFGPINLAVFEQISSQQNFEWAETLQTNRIGSGFLGLFRASVGQWYASVVLLAVASIAVLKGFHRIVAVTAVILGIGVILLSFSRAGIVGLAAGLLVLVVLSPGFWQRIAAASVTAIGIAWFFLQSSLVADRVASIATASDDASQTRFSAWHRSVELFDKDMSLFLTGAGPGSRGRVFELIGTYGAHNEYIDVVFRMGAGGVVLLAVVLLLIGRRLLQQRQAAEPGARAFVNAAIAIFVANCVMGLTQDHLLHDYSGHQTGVFLYFIYGVAVAMQAAAPLEERVSQAARSKPPNLLGGEPLSLQS